MQSVMIWKTWVGLTCVLALLCFGCRRAEQRNGDRDRGPTAAASVKAGSETGKPNTPESSDGVLVLDKGRQDLIALKTEPAREQRFERELTVLAKVIPRLQAESQVTAPVAGVIVPESVRWIPQIGAHVKKGRPLAVIEQTLNTPEKVQLIIDREKAEATLSQARRERDLRRVELERAKGLYEKKAASLKHFQEAELAYQLAVNHYESAARQREVYNRTAAENNTDIKRFTIVAPLSGTVVAADITPGQQTTPAKTLFTIIDLSRVWIEGSVFEKDLHYLTNIRTVKIKTAVYPDRVFEGRLITIGDVISPTTRTVTVLFEVANPDRKLKIGMYAEAALPTSEPVMAVAVPSSALLEDGGKQWVYVQTGPDRFMRSEVKLRFRRPDLVVLEGGVKVGEPVVIRGAQELLAEQFKSRIMQTDEH